VKTAIITLSEQGAALAKVLARSLRSTAKQAAARLEADARVLVYVHSSVARALRGAVRFDRISSLTHVLFPSVSRMIYIAPIGLVVRAIAPCVRHKLTDPAVVVVDVGGRWAVSLLSGHEGGANELAMTVANALSAEPVITTTTEAIKTIIVGVGCRRGTPADQIERTIRAALASAGVPLNRVRLIASCDLKADEPGLLAAARKLDVPLRFISSDEIRDSRRKFTRSKFVQRKVNLPAVAEPAALLAGRRTKLLLPKQIYPNVTVALAAENCTWSE